MEIISFVSQTNVLWMLTFHLWHAEQIFPQKSIFTLLEVQPSTKEKGQLGVISGTIGGPGGVPGHGNICSTSSRGGKANECRVPCWLPHSGVLQLQRGVSRRCLQGHRAHLRVRWPDGSVATGRAEIKLGWGGPPCHAPSLLDELERL